jgi:hypothetical protein
MLLRHFAEPTKTARDVDARSDLCYAERGGNVPVRQSVDASRVCGRTLMPGKTCKPRHTPLFEFCLRFIRRFGLGRSLAEDSRIEMPFRSPHPFSGRAFALK